ncbi:Mitochondrial intermediate peptidase [Microbotryomycetes sp. JL221]|nr:Mitochondrial intermediate peptidase [Microbotryomycetes sp. JL221]
MLTTATSVRPNLAQPAAHTSQHQGASRLQGDDDIHQAFDAPTSSYASTSTAHATGLFRQPSLTSPAAFVPLARRTTLRAKIIVDRLCRPQPTPTSIYEAEQQFLGMVKNLDRLSDLLCGVIDMAELVRNVHPDRGWVEAANDAYEELVEYMNELNTHVGLYQGLKNLYDKLPASTPSRSPALFAAYAVATPFLRDFEKSGIHLPLDQRNKFVTLSQSIVQLGRRFLQNSSEPHDPILITSNEVAEAFGEPMARRFFDGAKEGWVDPNSWEGRVLARQHPSEGLRRRLYQAGNTSPREHVETLEELLKTRAELALLVGRNSWSDVALEDKMAKTPDNVMGFLDALNRHTKPLAAKNLRVLERAKKQHGVSGPIQAWDRDFYSDVSNTVASNIPDITPFFSVGACFAGLSKLFSRLYGVRFEIEDCAAGEVWTRDVRKIRVIDEDEGRIGTIYCDLFARDGKQAGAAHYTVRCSRRVDDDDIEGDFDGKIYALVDGVQVSRQDMNGLDVDAVEWRGRPGKHQEPIIVLVCGFGSENGPEHGPAYLQWHEVETLFHEMGHAIHSMIGRTDYHNVSGTRCATDFVELPSILMEHFVSSPSVLALFARHPSTGRVLPTSILDDLLTDRQRLSALETSSQIMMAALDQQYHSASVLEPTFDSTEILSNAHDQFNVIPHAQGTSWQTQFGHLFGYGATYYSYLFDRAIAAKLFATKFVDDPLSRERGQELKDSVLKWGGGKEPWEMVGEVLKNDDVAKGGKEAMREVGRWGIVDSPRGR